MQKNPRGKLIETDERTNFIKENWQSITDYEMGLHLDLSFGSIVAYRTWLKLYREHRFVIRKEIKAQIAEQFFNGVPLLDISRTFGIAVSGVSRFISNDMFFKKKSEETEILVKQSKINDEHRR